MGVLVLMSVARARVKDERVGAGMGKSDLASRESGR